MKIRWYDRLLLFVTSVFLLVSAALFFGIPLLYGVRSDVILRLTNLPYDNIGQSLMIGGAAILLILSVYFLCVVFARKRVIAPKSVVIKQGEFGSVEITLDAIDTMVQKCARGFAGVKDCATKIAVTQFGDVAAYLKLQVMPDVDIPELTSKMQAEVKSYVEALSGINVREVRVMVESAGVNPAARV